MRLIQKRLRINSTKTLLLIALIGFLFFRNIYIIWMCLLYMEKSEQEKLKLTREMLKSADQDINSGIILCGVTKDKIINYFEFEKGELGYNEKIKFIVLARGISTPAFRTWTIHIGQPEIDIDRTPDKKHMDNDEIAKLGLRLNLEQARILVDCSDEVMDRYDDGSMDRYIRFQKGKLKEEHTEEEYKKLCKVMF